MGKAPSPAHLPTSGVKDLALLPKNHGRIIPSYRGRSGMTFGRLTASPEQSWGWNLGIAEPQLHPSSSPALGQNMAKALRECQGIQGSQTEQLLLVPGTFSHPMGRTVSCTSPAHRNGMCWKIWNMLENLEHRGNLQDKTSSHRRPPVVPIQTKKEKKKKRNQSSHIQKCHFRNSICHT